MRFFRQRKTYDVCIVGSGAGGGIAADGSVVEPARATVLHNGVLVQDAAEFTGRTVHGRSARYEPHADRLPLMLQDHGDPVRFRNIWVRDLPES